MFNSLHRATKDKEELWVWEMCVCLGGRGYPAFCVSDFVFQLSMPSVE